MMPVDDAVRDYLLLALRLGHRRPGTISVHSGDDELAARVRSEPSPSAGALVRAAGRLAADLPGLGLAPVRERFLRAQLGALETAARRLAGQRFAFAAELGATYDVPVRAGSPADYRAVHRDLDALLPGPGPLADRLAAHRAREAVPPARLSVAAEALTAALRERTRAAGLVAGAEGVEIVVVDRAPWAALHRRLGPGRSRVVLNAGAGIRRAQLARIVAHEAYPGHHTEQWRRETVLVGERGWAEHGVVVLGTPQSLLAEGSAEAGLYALVGPGWGPWASDVLATVGLGFDGELAEHVDACSTRLARVRLDAALLLHDGRARSVDVQDFLRRWLLVDEKRARRVLAFLADPLWRGHTVTYVEGVRLVRRWLDRPGGVPVVRLRELLDEPWTPGALRKALGE